MNLPHGIAVTIERPGGFDQYGNPLAGTTHEVSPCGVAPAGSTEQHHLESVAEWDVDLIAPYGADVESGDVVILPGADDRYEVHGRPQRFRSPFTGWEAGAIVRLKAVG